MTRSGGPHSPPQRRRFEPIRICLARGIGAIGRRTGGAQALGPGVGATGPAFGRLSDKTLRRAWEPCPTAGVKPGRYNGCGTPPFRL